MPSDDSSSDNPRDLFEFCCAECGEIHRLKTDYGYIDLNEDMDGPSPEYLLGDVRDILQ